MGEVCRANDTRLKRQVAIKLLSGNLADAEARRRFQREAQVASSLNHPHILTVHDAGEHDDRQYLVTELIDGGTLSDWARARPRSCHEIAELLTGVADGLAAAHEAGIVHRDIKPANVLVARNGYATLVAGKPSHLLKIAASAGDPTPLTDGLSTHPLWSPDGRFIVYSTPVQGARMQAKAITPDGKPHPFPELWVNYQTGSPYRFLAGGQALIYLKEGDVRHPNFFRVDLSTGDERQISDFRPGFEIRDFDIAPDGSRLLFDRLRSNSDVVLMDRTRPE